MLYSIYIKYKENCINMRFFLFSDTDRVPFLFVHMHEAWCVCLPYDVARHVTWNWKRAKSQRKVQIHGMLQAVHAMPCSCMRAFACAKLATSAHPPPKLMWTQPHRSSVHAPPSATRRAWKSWSGQVAMHKAGNRAPRRAMDPSSDGEAEHK